MSTERYINPPRHARQLPVRLRPHASLHQQHGLKGTIVKCSPAGFLCRISRAAPSARKHEQREDLSGVEPSGHSHFNGKFLWLILLAGPPDARRVQRLSKQHYVVPTTLKMSSFRINFTIHGSCSRENGSGAADKARLSSSSNSSSTSFSSVQLPLATTRKVLVFELDQVAVVQFS